MIVNRNDHHTLPLSSKQEDWYISNPDGTFSYGIGANILKSSEFESDEVGLVHALLEFRGMYFHDGVVAIDAGANIGTHTIEWARFMNHWGEVHSFEAQESVFYALAGNVAINNCDNVRARYCALGSECGTIQVPRLNPFRPASFGSLEYRQTDNNENIGQFVNYTAHTNTVPIISIDSMELPRVDFIKIDVEGMEIEVIKGAEQTIKKHKPILMVEIIKSKLPEIIEMLTDYIVVTIGINILAIHKDDPTKNHFIANSEVQ
jgi:FkbM family methyltransferase